MGVLFFIGVVWRYGTHPACLCGTGPSTRREAFGATPDLLYFLVVQLGLLVALVATQAPTFLLPGTAAWRAFGEAFARLPLP